MCSTDNLYDFDRWIPRFSGEGGYLRDFAGAARAVSAGFYIATQKCTIGSRGCFGLKVPRPHSNVFHVSFDCKILQVSFLFHEQLPRLSEQITHLFLVLAIPQSENAFEGNGACLVPITNNPAYLAPSMGVGWYFDTVWYCSLHFREVSDHMVDEIDPTQLEAATLPQEQESRDFVIRSCKNTSYSFGRITQQNTDNDSYSMGIMAEAQKPSWKKQYKHEYLGLVRFMRPPRICSIVFNYDRCPQGGEIFRGSICHRVCDIAHGCDVLAPFLTFDLASCGFDAES